MENYKFVRQHTRRLVAKINKTEIKTEKVVLKNGREITRPIRVNTTQEVPFTLGKYDFVVSRTDKTITYKHYSNKSYEQVVEDLIRLKYTVGNELAIHRQKEVKQDEYQEYFNYCEECKAYAKQLITERKNAIGV